LLLTEVMVRGGLVGKLAVEHLRLCTTYHVPILKGWHDCGKHSALYERFTSIHSRLMDVHGASIELTTTGSVGFRDMLSTHYLKQ
jgi:hypothetical protein